MKRETYILLLIPLAIIGLTSYSIYTNIQESPILIEETSPAMPEHVKLSQPAPGHLLIYQNAGQLNEATKYYIHSSYYHVSFNNSSVKVNRFSGSSESRDIHVHAAYKLSFEGSNSGILQGRALASAVTNIYRSNNSSEWNEGIPAYGELLYNNLYPGISLKYEGNSDKLKSTWYVEPGADPSMIHCKLEGVESLQVNNRGELEFRSGSHTFTESAPFIYQVKNKQKFPVEGNYVLTGYNSFGFAVGRYDPQLQLVIDPELVDTGSFGGTNYDTPVDMEIDQEGNMYVLGYTRSDDYPVKDAAIDSFPGGPQFLPQDAVLTKLNPTTGEIIYSTYLGGADEAEWPTGLVLDDAGNAYITGYTYSEDFPVLNAYQESFGGFEDAFLTKLNTSGQLEFSTFLGGSNGERAHDIALLDPLSRIVITGEGQSVPLVDPIHTPDGSIDGFISIFSNDGDSLLFSTTYGGSATDVFSAIKASDSGNLFIGGKTFSANFPTVDPIDNTMGGNSDAVIVKFNPQSSTVSFATFFGGGGFEETEDIAVDQDENIYMAGRTGSEDFPVVNEFNADLDDVTDGYVARMKEDEGSYNLDFSTILGGNGTENPRSIYLSNTGFINRLSVGGRTYSDDFPEIDPISNGITGATAPFGFIRVYDFPFNPAEAVTVSYSWRISNLLYLTAIRNYVEEKFQFVGYNQESEQIGYGTVETTPKAQLVIRKTAELDSVLVGDLVEFYIEVENVSEITAYDVVITDLLDNECFEFIDALEEHTYEEGPDLDIVTFELGDIPPAGEGDNKRILTVAVKMKKAGDCQNVAGASANNAEPVSTDVNVYAANSSLELSSTWTVEDPEIGEIFTIVYTLTNTGEVRETNAKIKTTYRSLSTNIVNIDSDLEYTIDSLNVTFETGLLEPGETVEVSVSYRLTSTRALHRELVDPVERIYNYFYEYDVFAYSSHMEKVDEIIRRSIPTKDNKVNMSLFRLDLNSGVSNKSESALKILPSFTNLYIDSTLLAPLPDADNGIIITEFPLPGIDPVVSLVAEGAELSDALYAEQKSLYSGNIEDESFSLPERYQFLIADFEDETVVVLKKNWRDTSDMSGMVDVYLAHLYEAEEQLDVLLAETGILLAEGLSYKEASAYSSLNPEQFTLELKTPAGAVLSTTSIDLSDYADQALTFLIVPYNESAPGIKVVGVVDSTLQAQQVSTVNSIDPVRLEQNINITHFYDHPFRIEYVLQSTMQTQISIYDMNGRKMTELVNAIKPPGKYVVGLHAKLPSGVYIYRFSAGGSLVSRKFVVY